MFDTVMAVNDLQDEYEFILIVIYSLEQHKVKCFSQGQNIKQDDSFRQFLCHHCSTLQTHCVIE